MQGRGISTPRHVGGDETRAALIVAATAVFLDDGFRAARVADIAKRADQRLSAINYHFGGKEGLYLAVLRHHAELAMKQTPLSPPDTLLPLRQQLDFAVHALVERLLNPASASRIGPLMLREMVNPTAALEVLFEHFSLPQIQVMLTLARRIVGANVPEERVKRAVFSLFGQCAAYVMARPLILKVAAEIYDGDDFIQRIAEHVSSFSWAGLQAIREEWEVKT